MPGRIIYIACVLLFAFGKLSANDQPQPGRDSLAIDTVVISTDHCDEAAIHAIDSICKRHEQLLQKMPVPVFVRPEGGKSIYVGNDAYRSIMILLIRLFPFVITGTSQAQILWKT